MEVSRKGRRERKVFSILWVFFASFAFSAVHLSLSAAQDIPQASAPTPAQVRATVFLMRVYTTVNGSPIISCVGSGTLVSADGLILTNAHNFRGRGTACRADATVVALTVRDGEPPLPVYFAEPVVIEAGLDLAVLRITRYLDGRRVLPGELVLPFVELGDSDALKLGDPVTVVGYPSIGQEPVGASAGTVGAFLAEARVGSRAWIKVEASVPGTMSGGGAYNDAGQLVGIPTIVPVGVAGQAVDCRVIQDTNEDGLIDTRDACVALGGFVSALRPARLARPLVRAAQLDVRAGDTLSAPASNQPAGMAAGAPTFGGLFFAPAVDQAGQPTTVLAAAPAGIDRLYLFFDYANMDEGITYELRTTIDGVPDSRFSLPPAAWSGDTWGLWYLGIEGQVLPDGHYECQLFIEGQPSGGPARIVVGGAAQQVAMFTDPVFGLEGGNAGQLVGSGHVLPAGISVVNAQFVYQNMTEGLPWGARWYYEGVEFQAARTEGPWTDPPGNGVKQVRVTSAEGMRPGRYRLELYLSGRLAAQGDLVIAGGQVGTGASIFGPVTFSSAVDANGRPAGTTGPVIAGGAERLYAFFDYQNIAPGTVWTQRWSVDNEPIITLHRPWNGPESGQGWSIGLGTLSGGRLPNGVYQLELWVGNERLQVATVTLGAGGASKHAARPVGVHMYGSIVDAETGRGIPGALFIVLRAEFAIADFVWDADQVLASSVADADGRFEIPVRLAPDAFYSVVVSAEGYLPVTADGIYIGPETPDPLPMRVEMNKD